MRRFNAARRLFTLAAASAVSAAATLLAAVPALAAPRLAAIFGDGMVLQRDKPVHIWGWAEPGEALQAEFRGETLSAQAGWRVGMELRLVVQGGLRILGRMEASGFDSLQRRPALGLRDVAWMMWQALRMRAQALPVVPGAA